MQTIITNAFSLNMLEASFNEFIFWRKSVEEAREFAGEPFTSAVGHPDTAVLFSALLGVKILDNRVNVALDSNTRLLVGQYTGPRLEPGTTRLPEGATVTWWLVVPVRVRG